VKPVVAILGGSTPFTAALVEALRAASAGIPACELRLFGQDQVSLERMKCYAHRRLAGFGWTVSARRRLDEAVDRATVVVNQIRFGGLAGRSRDEALANRFQLPADETLGPCGLNAALRVVPRIRELAAELGRRCADAWILNLSNPLSITTRAMIRAGAPPRCAGLCELPLATVVETCRVLRISLADVEWEYAGLNHRGFVFALKHRGEDLMPRLPEMLDRRDIFGMTGEDVRRVGALPLKYFRLSTSATTAAASGRAEFLGDLKKTIALELEEQAAPPPSLSRRDLSWYEGAVVPMIAAIFADDGRRMIVNCLRGDGLVREVPARVWRDGVEVVATKPPARLAPWIERWAAHERALLEAVESPSLERIEHALALDPAVPGAQVREVGRAIWDGYEN
jgi:6-phospho-beta-glucosidase